MSLNCIWYCFLEPFRVACCYCLLLDLFPPHRVLCDFREQKWNAIRESAIIRNSPAATFDLCFIIFLPVSFFLLPFQSHSRMQGRKCFWRWIKALATDAPPALFQPPVLPWEEGPRHPPVGFTARPLPPSAPHLSSPLPLATGPLKFTSGPIRSAVKGAFMV